MAFGGPSPAKRKPMPKKKSDDIELEIKLTYLEDTVSELNKVVFEQQKTIDKLKDLMGGLTDRVRVIEDRSEDDDSVEPPPHY